MKIVSEGPLLDEMSRDAGIIEVRPRAVYFAEDEGDVSMAVEEARKAGTTITPRGGGTSIPSQSIGPGFILVQQRSRVQTDEAWRVRCDPGVVKASLNETLGQSGLWVPVDPSSYRSCTVGGMIANNSSGVRTLKYGSTFRHVTGLRAVLPESGPQKIEPMKLEDALDSEGETGRVARLLLENKTLIEKETPKVTKNSCGYRLESVIHDGVFDLPRLFVGSEGTLGVITEATFRTSRKPGSRVLLVLETSQDELGEVVSSMRALGPSAIELLDKSVFDQTGKGGRLLQYSKTDDPYLVFCEFDGAAEGDAELGLEKVADSPLSQLEPRVLLSQLEIADAWEVRNETLTIAGEIRVGRQVLLPGVEDLVAPPSRLSDLVKLLAGQFERRGLRYISYGHAGDANLHMRPLLDPDPSTGLRVLHDIMEECFEAVWKMGGSITGEHGDGMLRAPFVERQYPGTYHIMKEIRDIYDPKRILSPGVKIV